MTPLSSLLPGHPGTLKLLAKSPQDADLSIETNAIPLEAYSVYVGELRNAAGLETVVVAPHAHRR